MKVAIGSDHGGFPLKQEVIAFLEQKGYAVEDCGTDSLDSCDYPAYGIAVAKAVQEGRVPFGIVICTTGIGISIAANKMKGIRCGLCHDVTTARLTRAHNDANMLSLGGGFVAPFLAKEIVETFLTTPFSGEEKHSRRIRQVMAIEE